jgi:hypothetical protein
VRRGRADVLALVAVLASACGDASYRGSWEVVGYKRPAVSVLGDIEARGPLGVTLEVGKEAATLAGDSCVIGSAQRQTLTVRNLEMAFDLSRGELGIPQESVEMMDLQCTTGQLEFGQQLIRIAPDSVLTPWRGVFLVLEKR